MIFKNPVRPLLYMNIYSSIMNSTEIGRKFVKKCQDESFKSADHEYIWRFFSGQMNNLIQSNNSRDCAQIVLAIIRYVNNWKMHDLYTNKDEQILVGMLEKYVNYFRDSYSHNSILYYLFSVDFTNKQLWNLLHRTWPAVTDKQWIIQMIYLALSSSTMQNELPYVDNFIMLKKYALNTYGSNIVDEISEKAILWYDNNDFNIEKFYDGLPNDYQLGVLL